jgi:hypothetical protein
MSKLKFKVLSKRNNHTTLVFKFSPWYQCRCWFTPSLTWYSVPWQNSGRQKFIFYKQGVGLAIHIKKYLKANKEELYGNSNISP